MVKTSSTMLTLGTKLPEFNLPDAYGQSFSSSDLLTEKGLLVAFWCNHCPYVQHLKTSFAELTKLYVNKGLGVVAINSNDASKYNSDSPEGMIGDIEKYNYVFPYLIDEDQSIARSFEAVCTPEFYLFSGDGLLQYRGRYDASTPMNGEPINGNDIKAAIDLVMQKSPVPDTQHPSVGCSIKWKA